MGSVKGDLVGRYEGATVGKADGVVVVVVVGTNNEGVWVSEFNIM